MRPAQQAIYTRAAALQAAAQAAQAASSPTGQDEDSPHNAAAWIAEQAQAAAYAAQQWPDPRSPAMAALTRALEVAVMPEHHPELTAELECLHQELAYSYGH